MNIEDYLIDEDIPNLRHLIAENPELLYYKAEDGETLLQMAYRFGSFRAANFLLRNGAEREPLDSTFRACILAVVTGVRFPGRSNTKVLSDRGIRALDLLLKKCRPSAALDCEAVLFEGVKRLPLREAPSLKTMLDIDRIVGKLSDCHMVERTKVRAELSQMGFTHMRETTHEYHLFCG